MSRIVHPCPCCKFLIEFPDDCQILPCPACDRTVARPQATGSMLEKLQRALDLRMAHDFKAAEQAYEDLLKRAPHEHEALWGRLLCHYGVEYVEEPATGRRYPVMHFVRSMPMQEHVDFRLACEHAPESIRRQYEQDAQYIDNTLAAIRQSAASAEPYDVFICHKTTKPGSQEKTEDFVQALRLYHFLKDNGIRAFFAPECLQSAVGSDYEAGIYHALSTARTMLVLCSSKEYLNSTWVRSEWTRFLILADSQPGKQLIPLLYDHFPADDLPDAFRRRKLQGLDMNRITAAQTLLDVLSGVRHEPQALNTEYHADVDFPNIRRTWKTIPAWKVFSSDQKTILTAASWEKTVRVPLPADHDVLWIGPADAPEKLAQAQKSQKRAFKLMLATAAVGVVSLLAMLAFVFLAAVPLLLFFFIWYLMTLRRVRSCFVCSFQVASGRAYALTWSNETVSDRLKASPK